MRPERMAQQDAAGAAEPALDLVAGLDRVMGDRAMHLRVLARFRSDYHDAAARLRRALAAGDAALAQRVVHTLKGAAAMVEARRLRQLALGVELAFRTHGEAALQPASALADELAAELGRVLEQLDTVLSAPRQDAVVAAASPEEVVRLRAMLDIGDGAALALLAQRHDAFLAALGPERMRLLDAAVRDFDFERALAVLEGRGDA